jgi:hypothetical protein
MNRLPHGSRRLKDLLGMSWRSLILAAIAEAHEFFTPGFVRQAELASPFRFAFLRARRKKFVGRSGLYENLFNRFVESDRSPAPERISNPAPVLQLQD